MHPDDVADLVATDAAEVQARLAAEPGLGTTSFTLEDRFELFIGFEVVLRHGAATPMGVVPLLGTAHHEQRFLHLDCSDWDGQPPLVDLLQADRTPLPPEHWPSDPQQQGIVAGHPLYGDRKFFCRPGTREFHTHPQHSDNPWDLYRPTRKLDQLAIDLMRDIRDRFIFG